MSRQKYNSIKPQLNHDAISAQGGFTLIELLVAAAGGLILMGFMAVVFGFMAELYEKIRQSFG